MIYEVATWAAVAVLGPGSVAVFAWFLQSFFRPAPPGRGRSRNRSDR